MIHESWHAHNHPVNDHVNGSRYGRNQLSKRIIMKPRYGRNHPIMRRITYNNSWYGHSHPSERDMYINMTMSHCLATWTCVVLVLSSKIALSLATFLIHSSLLFHEKCILIINNNYTLPQGEHFGDLHVILLCLLFE